MEINDMIRLIEAVSANSLTGFELEQGDLKLSIQKKAPKVIRTAGISESEELVVAVDTPSQPVSSVPVKAEIASDKVVTSPLVGTFYNASAPGAEPFVKEGDTVKKGQVLGIIEAMKLMNEIESEYDGVVEAVLVGNEEVVEYGQPLFRIR